MVHDIPMDARKSQGTEWIFMHRVFFKWNTLDACEGGVSTSIAYGCAASIARATKISQMGLQVFGAIHGANLMHYSGAS